MAQKNIFIAVSEETYDNWREKRVIGVFSSAVRAKNALDDKRYCPGIRPVCIKNIPSSHDSLAVESRRRALFRSSIDYY